MNNISCVIVVPQTAYNFSTCPLKTATKNNTLWVSAVAASEIWL